MRLIIAGSRTLEPSLGFITDVIKLFHITNISEIVSGAAKGVDQEGEHWASHNLESEDLQKPRRGAGRAGSLPLCFKFVSQFFSSRRHIGSGYPYSLSA